MFLRYYMLENRPRNLYGMVCHSCQNAPRNTKECKNNLFTTLSNLFFFSFSTFIFTALCLQTLTWFPLDLNGPNIKLSYANDRKWKRTGCVKADVEKSTASVFREQSEIEGSSEFSRDPLATVLSRQRESNILHLLFLWPQRGVWQLILNLTASLITLHTWHCVYMHPSVCAHAWRQVLPRPHPIDINIYQRMSPFLSFLVTVSS